MLRDRARKGYQQIFTLPPSQTSCIKLLQKIKNSIRGIAIITFPLSSGQFIYGVLLFDSFKFPKLMTHLYLFEKKKQAETFYTDHFLPPHSPLDKYEDEVKTYLILLQYYWIVNIDSIIRYIQQYIQTHIQNHRSQAPIPPLPNVLNLTFTIPLHLLPDTQPPLKLFLKQYLQQQQKQKQLHKPILQQHSHIRSLRRSEDVSRRTKQIQGMFKTAFQYTQKQQNGKKIIEYTDFKFRPQTQQLTDFDKEVLKDAIDLQSLFYIFDDDNLWIMIPFYSLGCGFQELQGVTIFLGPFSYSVKNIQDLTIFLFILIHNIQLSQKHIDLLKPLVFEGKQIKFISSFHDPNSSSVSSSKITPEILQQSLSKKQQQKQQQKKKVLYLQPIVLQPIVCSVIEKCFRNKKQQGTQQDRQRDRQREDKWIDSFWS